MLQRNPGEEEIWNENGIPSGFCFGRLTRKIYPQDQDETLEKYKEWRLKLTDVNQEIIEQQENIRYLSGCIEKMISANVAETDPTLIDKLTSRANREDKLQNLKTEQKKGLYLAKRYSDIHRNRMMERITFWQNVINYILYVSAAMQIIILGLGVFEWNVFEWSKSDFILSVVSLTLGIFSTFNLK